MEKDFAYKYYYIVNEDLNMSPGKIAAQVSHVAMLLKDKYPTTPLGKAIIVKGPTKQLLDTIKMFPQSVFIQDAGLTEVPEGSLTCVGLRLFLPENVNIKYLRNLKLL